jgi:hypothetical protein
MVNGPMLIQLVVERDLPTFKRKIEAILKAFRRT